MRAEVKLLLPNPPASWCRDRRVVSAPNVQSRGWHFVGMSGQTWESCGEEPDRMVAINVRAADRDGARGEIDGAPRTSPVMAAFVIL